VTTANCPSCGAAIEFAIGSSEVVICAYCRSIVARTDRGMETHGKVAALIDTGSPLRTGTTGRYRGVGFRITGRTQLRHLAGGVWDEWYAALDDGRWAWLAEAQGRFYVTFRVAAEAPARGALQLGATILDGMVVAEIGSAELLSAEGELPWTPDAGSSYEYADLTSADRRFATIDYSGEPPLVFKGVETSLAELGIAGEARRTRVAAVTLNCPSCGGAIELRAPDHTERVWCPYCGAGSDVSSGKLTFFKKLKKSHVAPVIPLGTKGTLDGDEYVVAGFMERAVRFDRDYFWTEYLLFNRDRGFRWLVDSDEHWSFVTPLRPGEVLDSEPLGAAKRVRYQGREYKLFQDAPARVTYVAGEFYWKVAAGETVNTADWIRPPFGISKEVTVSGAQEIAYSHARYLKPREIEKAFGVEKLNRPVTVGPIQPYRGPKLAGAWIVMLALLCIVAIALGVMLPGKRVLNQEFNLGAEPPVEGGIENGRVSFSSPFALSGNYNVAIRADSHLDNTWLWIAADLVEESTGALYSTEIPLEYYSGGEAGERWSEGSHTKTKVLPRPEKGRYTLRLETQWEERKPPPSLRVKVTEGVFRWSYFLAALAFISILPLLAISRQIAFESERWKESAHNPFATGESGEDEEE
jgi:hypothetical protein